MATPIVLTKASTFDLTTLETVKAELGLTSSDAMQQDIRLRRYITAASKGIARVCHRRFARQAYRQSLKGTGRVLMQLGETPVVAASTINKTDSTGSIAITDYTLFDAERGWLYRELGWDWTMALLMGRQTSALNISGSIPAIGFDRWSYVVDFTAGYLLPGDDYLAPTIAFVASSKSITDSANKLPLLVAGDEVKVLGSASNDGTYTVVTRTAGAVTVAEDLTDESAGAAIYLTVRNLEEDLEMIAIHETVLQWRRGNRDSTITSERVEGETTSYMRADKATGLMPDTVAALPPFIRMAA